MGERIDQFCEDLRLKLTEIDNGLDSLKAKVRAGAEHVQQDVQSHLDRVEQRIEQNRAELAAAQADVKAWVDQRKAATQEKIAEWKAKRQIDRLENRADLAESYAAAARVIAAAALDEAEQAALEAWLARHDADAAKAKQVAHT